MGQTRVKYHNVEYDGETYRLAKPTKGRDIPNDEKIKIASLVCLMYETDDYSLDECCKTVAISVRTFFNWRRDISEISTLYLDADNEKEQIYRHKLRNRARTNAERLMDGYTVELIEREAEPSTDSEGNVIMRTTKVKRKEVFIRPSVKLTETVLYNMDKDNFEKNPSNKIEKQDKTEFDDWTDEQIIAEINRLTKEGL